MANEDDCTRVNGHTTLTVSSRLETSVLIVGGGPSGLLTAILLARYGIRSIVLEKYMKRLGQPKAHAVNPRSLEIMRQAGLDTVRLREIGVNAKDGDGVRFAASMVGVEFGWLPYERQDEAVKQVTPEPLFNIAQPLLEQFLTEHSNKMDLATVHRGWQWQSCVQQTDTTITSTILERETGKHLTIQSKYVIGCDGARAASREAFRIPFEPLAKDPKPIYYCSTHIKADLSHLKSGTLWFIMSRNTIRIFIVYDRRDNFVFVIIYDPETTPASTFTHEYLRAELDQCIGAKVDFEILGITLWTTTPQVAQSYRSKIVKRGFLAGDAAHCFPSTGGLGVNTGLADVHNLAWKIHAVENGWHPTTLLDSYTTERQPVAQANSRQSALNEEKIMKLLQTINAGPGNPESRMRSGDSRKMIEDAIRDNYDHFDSLNLQIGYVYGQHAALDRICYDFRAECVPGGRLPHSWVRRGSREISTLDLVDGLSYVLLASADWSQEWQSDASNIPVTVLRAGLDFSDDEGVWLRLMGLDAPQSAVLVRPDQHIVAKVDPTMSLHKLLACGGH